MQALKQERMRRTREGAPASILAETEDALVWFFTEGCRFEMQAGHMERAVASIQAALEYACFAPSIPVGMLSCVVQLMLGSHLLRCAVLSCLCSSCYGAACCTLCMPCCAVPCCPVLCSSCSAVTCCALLSYLCSSCCAVACCTLCMPCCCVPCCAVLCCPVLSCPVLHCAVLCCVILCCAALLLLCHCSDYTVLHAWLCSLVLSIADYFNVGDT